MKKTFISLVALSAITTFAFSDNNIAIGNFKGPLSAEKMYNKALKNLSHLGEVKLEQIDGFYVVYLKNVSKERDTGTLLKDVRKIYKNSYIMKSKDKNSNEKRIYKKSYISNNNKNEPVEKVEVKKTDNSVEKVEVKKPDNKEKVQEKVISSTIFTDINSEVKPNKKEKPVKSDIKPLKNDIKPHKTLKSTKNFSLNSLISRMLVENNDIKSSELNYLQAIKTLKAARNNIYLPTIDTTASYGYVNQREKDGNSKDSKGTYSSYGLNLTQNLYNGGFDKARAEVAEHQLKAAGYSHIQNTDKKILEAVSAYLEVLKTYDLMNIAEDNLQKHKDTYKQIEDRVRVGYSQKSDISQAGVKLSLARTNYISAIHNYKDAKVTFKKIFGFNTEASSLITPVIDISLFNNLKELNRVSYECNPSLKISEENIKISKSVEKEKLSEFLPKINLEAYVLKERKNFGSDNDRDEDKSGVTFKFKYNLFNKGIDRLEKQKAHLAFIQTNENDLSLKRDIEESNELALNIYQNSREKLKYLKEQLSYAGDTLSAYTEEFKIGQRDIVNLLDAQSEYNNVSQEIVKTENEILLSKYRVINNAGFITDTFEKDYAKKYIDDVCIYKK